MTATILASFPSPTQGVWHIGVVPIRAYALCIIAGIVAALIIGDRRWVARGGERGVIYDVALWAVPFGLIGGRLYHVITDWSTYFGPNKPGLIGALRIWDGGLGIWGAVALGGVGAWIACRRRGIPLPAFGDAIAPGIILAQAIGRLGNYFNQELFGRETSMPWGLVIYERTNAAGNPDMLNGVSTGVPKFSSPVHPTFLYELLWNLLVFAVLIWADRRFKLGHGRLFALYVAGYCLGRFWIELMRSDYATTIAGIRINTFTATFVFIGAVIYIMAAPKGREDPDSLRGNAFAESDAKLDSPGDEATDVAATSGIAAATKVAAEDEPDESDDESEPDGPEESVPDTLWEVEEDSEAAAEAEELTAAVADAPADSERLGAVQADEVIEAVEDASEVHDAAVERADDADALVDEVAKEPEPDTADPDSAEADEAEPESADASEPEPYADAAADEPSEDAEPAEAEDVTPDAEGLGAVEPDEVVEAVEDAPEVHADVVDLAEDAEAFADEVAEEAEADAVEPESDAEAVESESAEVAESEQPAEQAADEPRGKWWRRRS